MRWTADDTRCSVHGMWMVQGFVGRGALSVRMSLIIEMHRGI